MFVYAFRRLLGAIPTILILMTATFFLLRLAPGGPFDGDQVWPPEIQANIAHKYELDLPLHIQYWHWLKGVFQGDLRDSFQYIGRPVGEMIQESLPVSALLGGWSLIFSLVFGILLGGISAWKSSTWIDRMITFIATAGVSLPSYLVASILILLFSLYLGWFPPALWEDPSSMVLPVIALAWRPMSILIQLTRSSLLQELSSKYIQTAHGKGLHPFKVVFKHALKNSLIPVVTMLGPLAANLITGSFIIEIIFQIPGLGKYFVQAVLNRDYPLVMGVTLTYGLILVLSNLMVDLLYGWIDPRIRVGES